MYYLCYKRIINYSKGDKDLQGIIHICGNFDMRTDCHLTCGNGLNLIVKLLDYEYNKGKIPSNTLNYNKFRC